MTQIRYIRILLISMSLFWALKSDAQTTERYLNNPFTGIVTYDFKIRGKVATIQDDKLPTNSNYIYLSDVLRENCFNANGMLNKKQLYKNIKGHCDSIFNFTINQRYDIRIFPEYNGSEPCRNSTVISSGLTDDGKLLINYPKALYRILSRQKYPPIVIKALFPEKFRITKNIAILDFRNIMVQSIYNTALALFAEYLQEPVEAPSLRSSTNASREIKKGDFVGRIKMGFVGPWGEGITYLWGKNADSESLIKIAEMYKKYFYEYWLIAPSYGMRTGTTNNERLIPFEYYLLTTKYGLLNKKEGVLTGNKEFGLFIDHIGTEDCDRDFSLAYKGKPFRQQALRKFIVAPVIGENSGNLKYEEKRIISDIKEFGISLCNIWINSYTQIADSLSYPVWKENSLYFGYRFYLSNNKTKIENGQLKLFFLMGNNSFSPLYDDFWLPQVVIRDKYGKELKVVNIDKNLNLRQIPCKKSPLNYMVMVNTTKQIGYVPAGAKVFFRVIDRCHINENMFLDNNGRTANGEYELKE